MTKEEFMPEPKFKVGEKVYFYDYAWEKKIIKDEIVKIECDEYSFWYRLKNHNFLSLGKNLFKTFEECKADCISRYEAMILNLQIASKYQSIMMILETHKKMLEKIKGQEEVK